MSQVNSCDAFIFVENDNLDMIRNPGMTKFSVKMSEPLTDPELCLDCPPRKYQEIDTEAFLRRFPDLRLGASNYPSKEFARRKAREIGDTPERLRYGGAEPDRTLLGSTLGKYGAYIYDHRNKRYGCKGSDADPTKCVAEFEGKAYDESWFRGQPNVVRMGNIIYCNPEQLSDTNHWCSKIAQEHATVSASGLKLDEDLKVSLSKPESRAAVRSAEGEELRKHRGGCPSGSTLVETATGLACKGTPFRPAIDGFDITPAHKIIGGDDVIYKKATTQEECARMCATSSWCKSFSTPLSPYPPECYLSTSNRKNLKSGAKYSRDGNWLLHEKRPDATTAYCSLPNMNMHGSTKAYSTAYPTCPRSGKLDSIPYQSPSFNQMDCKLFAESRGTKMEGPGNYDYTPRGCTFTDKHVLWNYRHTERNKHGSWTKVDKHKYSEHLSGDGRDYRGYQNKTQSGRKCAAWKGRLGIRGHNYCRNPNGAKTIWCYTTDPFVRYEYCKPFPTTRPVFSRISRRQVTKKTKPKPEKFDRMYTAPNLIDTLLMTHGLHGTDKCTRAVPSAEESGHPATISAKHRKPGTPKTLKECLKLLDRVEVNAVEFTAEKQCFFTESQRAEFRPSSDSNVFTKYAVAGARGTHSGTRTKSKRALLPWEVKDEDCVSCGHVVDNAGVCKLNYAKYMPDEFETAAFAHFDEGRKLLAHVGGGELELSVHQGGTSFDIERVLKGILNKSGDGGNEATRTSYPSIVQRKASRYERVYTNHKNLESFKKFRIQRGGFAPYRNLQSGLSDIADDSKQSVWRARQSVGPGLAELEILVDKGANPSKLDLPLGRCQGDCDDDRDCMPGLKCFQREKGEPVPGCASGGPGDIPGRDYCYAPMKFAYKGNEPAPNIVNKYTHAPKCGANGLQQLCQLTGTMYQGKNQNLEEAMKSCIELGDECKAVGCDSNESWCHPLKVASKDVPLYTGTGKNMGSVFDKRSSGHQFELPGEQDLRYLYTGNHGRNHDYALVQGYYAGQQRSRTWPDRMAGYERGYPFAKILSRKPAFGTRELRALYRRYDSGNHDMWTNTGKYPHNKIGSGFAQGYIYADPIPGVTVPLFDFYDPISGKRTTGIKGMSTHNSHAGVLVFNGKRCPDSHPHWSDGTLVKAQGDYKGPVCSKFKLQERTVWDGHNYCNIDGDRHCEVGSWRGILPPSMKGKVGTPANHSFEKAKEMCDKHADCKAIVGAWGGKWAYSKKDHSGFSPHCAGYRKAKEGYKNVNEWTCWPSAFVYDKRKRTRGFDPVYKIDMKNIIPAFDLLGHAVKRDHVGPLAPGKTPEDFRFCAMGGDRCHVAEGATVEVRYGSGRHGSFTNEFKTGSFICGAGKQKADGWESSALERTKYSCWIRGPKQEDPLQTDFTTPRSHAELDLRCMLNNPDYAIAKWRPDPCTSGSPSLVRSEILPIKNDGQECWKQCGRKGGPCPGFCGGGLCCKGGYAEDGCPTEWPSGDKNRYTCRPRAPDGVSGNTREKRTCTAGVGLGRNGHCEVYGRLTAVEDSERWGRVRRQGLARLRTEAKVFEEQLKLQAPSFSTLESAATCRLRCDESKDCAAFSVDARGVLCELYREIPKDLSTDKIKVTDASQSNRILHIKQGPAPPSTTFRCPKEHPNMAHYSNNPKWNVYCYDKGASGSGCRIPVGARLPAPFTNSNIGINPHVGPICDVPVDVMRYIPRARCIRRKNDTSMSELFVEHDGTRYRASCPYNAGTEKKQRAIDSGSDNMTIPSNSSILGRPNGFDNRDQICGLPLGGPDGFRIKGAPPGALVQAAPNFATCPIAHELKSKDNVFELPSGDRLHVHCRSTANEPPPHLARGDTERSTPYVHLETPSGKERTLDSLLRSTADRAFAGDGLGIWNRRTSDAGVTSSPAAKHSIKRIAAGTGAIAALTGIAHAISSGDRTHPFLEAGDVCARPTTNAHRLPSRELLHQYRRDALSSHGTRELFGGLVSKWQVHGEAWEREKNIEVDFLVDKPKSENDVATWAIETVLGAPRANLDNKASEGYFDDELSQRLCRCNKTFMGAGWDSNSYTKRVDTKLGKKRLDTADKRVAFVQDALECFAVQPSDVNTATKSSELWREYVKRELKPKDESRAMVSRQKVAKLDASGVLEPQNDTPEFLENLFFVSRGSKRCKNKGREASGVYGFKGNKDRTCYDWSSGTDVVNVSHFSTHLKSWDEGHLENQWNYSIYENLHLYEGTSNRPGKNNEWKRNFHGFFKGKHEKMHKKYAKDPGTFSTYNKKVFRRILNDGASGAIKSQFPKMKTKLNFLGKKRAPTTNKFGNGGVEIPKGSRAFNNNAAIKWEDDEDLQTSRSGRSRADMFLDTHANFMSASVIDKDMDYDHGYESEECNFLGLDCGGKDGTNTKRNTLSAYVDTNDLDKRVMDRSDLTRPLDPFTGKTLFSLDDFSASKIEIDYCSFAPKSRVYYREYKNKDVGALCKRPIAFLDPSKISSGVCKATLYRRANKYQGGGVCHGNQGLGTEADHKAACEGSGGTFKGGDDLACVYDVPKENFGYIQGPHDGRVINAISSGPAVVQSREQAQKICDNMQQCSGFSIEQGCPISKAGKDCVVRFLKSLKQMEKSELDQSKNDTVFLKTGLVGPLELMRTICDDNPDCGGFTYDSEGGRASAFYRTYFPRPDAITDGYKGPLETCLIDSTNVTYHEVDREIVSTPKLFSDPLCQRKLAAAQKDPATFRAFVSGESDLADRVFKEHCLAFSRNPNVGSGKPWGEKSDEIKSRLRASCTGANEDVCRKKNRCQWHPAGVSYIADGLSTKGFCDLRKTMNFSRRDSSACRDFVKNDKTLNGKLTETMIVDFQKKYPHFRESSCSRANAMGVGADNNIGTISEEFGCVHKPCKLPGEALVTKTILDLGCQVNVCNQTIEMGNATIIGRDGNEIATSQSCKIGGTENMKPPGCKAWVDYEKQKKQGLADEDDAINAINDCIAEIGDSFRKQHKLPETCKINIKLPDNAVGKEHQKTLGGTQCTPDGDWKACLVPNQKGCPAKLTKSFMTSCLDTLNSMSGIASYSTEVTTKCTPNPEQNVCSGKQQCRASNTRKPCIDAVPASTVAKKATIDGIEFACYPGSKEVNFPIGVDANGVGVCLSADGRRCGSGDKDVDCSTYLDQAKATPPKKITCVPAMTDEYTQQTNFGTTQGWCAQLMHKSKLGKTKLSKGVQSFFDTVGAECNCNSFFSKVEPNDDAGKRALCSRIADTSEAAAIDPNRTITRLASAMDVYMAKSGVTKSSCIRLNVNEHEKDGEKALDFLFTITGDKECVEGQNAKVDPRDFYDTKPKKKENTNTLAIALGVVGGAIVIGGLGYAIYMAMTAKTATAAAGAGGAAAVAAAAV